MSSRGAVKLSAIESIDEREFRHLLAWISRAYEGPARRDGTRHASSSDGRATIALLPPRHPERERARLRVPHGTLELPDFRIEVLER